MSCMRLLPDVLPPGEVVVASHHVHLEPLPRHVSIARSFVRQHAPVLPEDTADALVLLTSELVTNAVLHARTTIELGITVADHCVLITVHDEDLTRPS
jgi:anti-sigma regulatory factor (Ser/Thr protein kinase)